MTSAFAEKAGVIESQAGGYAWTQTREEVVVKLKVAENVRGRDLLVDVTPTNLTVGLKAQPEAPWVKGALFATVKHKDTLWTLEDGTLEIVLQKVKLSETWKSLLQGGEEMDALTASEIQKKIMLEKFQVDHPGFDFSGAEFNGAVPEDPEAFGRFDERR